MKYDFLIVGAGLFGAVFAEQAVKKGYRCLVIEPIFFIPPTKRSGITSISLRNLIIISILRLRFIRMRPTIFRSI